MQHTPTGEGDFTYVLTIHQGTSGAPVTQATSNTITRKIPNQGDTLWTRQFGTNSNELAEGVATDAAGNIIIAGYTSASLEGTNAGGYDAFVHKYGPDGDTLWTRQLGSDSADFAYGAITDPAGNIIITGSTHGSLEGTNAGSYDAFVRKYGPNGDTLWTRQLGTTADDQALDVATDASGNIIITGYTEGSLEGTNAGASDAFVRKFTP